MAVEVTHFHNLLDARKGIAVGHSHRTHESRTISVQEIRRDGAMSVICFFGKPREI
jgi:hypothetical protein